MWEFIKYCFLCMARGLGDATDMTWKEVWIGLATVAVLLGMVVGLYALFVFFTTRKK